ncbi:hypothetical protein [Pseudonocardia lacus]|uniref:hypothetical protein n=1 Tax=Pseudonocardia lacus TaxID=2835865 RepID=UPI001BDD6E5C|nr:hypothetical protein [Pseudonocardia lacus]
MLGAIHAMRSCEFWPDELSYADADLRHVRDHRQVTDAYLVGPAAGRRGAKRATMDEGLCQDQPERTLLLPRI